MFGKLLGGHKEKEGNGDKASPNRKKQYALCVDRRRSGLTPGAATRRSVKALSGS